MKTAGDTIADLRKKGCAIPAGDESAVLPWAGNGHSRRPAGGRETVKTRSSNYSVKVFRAAGGGVPLPMPADSTDPDEFIDLT